MQDILTLASKNVTVDSRLCDVRIKSDFVKQDYLNAIDSMIDYIRAGDILYCKYDPSDFCRKFPYPL